MVKESASVYVVFVCFCWLGCCGVVVGIDCIEMKEQTEMVSNDCIGIAKCFFRPR